MGKARIKTSENVCMKKKNKKYQPKPKGITALVARYIKPFEFDLPEMLTLDAFKRGRATDQSLRSLEDYMNLILIGNDMNPAIANKALANEFVVMVDSIFKRYFKTKSIGVNAEERDKLPKLILAYQSYWLARSAGFYNTCLDELSAFYKDRSAIVPYKKEAVVLGMAA